MFKIDTKETDTPLFTEPYWGGYYGAEPFIHVYQVSVVISFLLIDDFDVHGVDDPVARYRPFGSGMDGNQAFLF